MVQEEQNQIGVGGSKSSKKLKQKKVPQRGLGVAQLERIRIEELQKQDEGSLKLSPSSSTLPSNSSSSSISIPLLNYPHNQSSSSVPLRPPSPTRLPSPSSLFKVHSLPSFENFHLNLVPPVNPRIGGAFDVGWPAIPVHGNVSFPKMRNPYEFNHEGDNFNHGLDFRPNVTLPYESCTFGPLPRAPQFQQQPSTMVKVSSVNSSTSVLSFPMEPPSNQSPYMNYAPLWPEEEKTAGKKRPYPFPLENPPVPPFHTKVPSVAHPISRSDESTSCRNGNRNGNGNQGTCNWDPPIPTLREPTSYPIAILDQNSKKITDETGTSHSGFLSLAPPAVTSPLTSPTFKPPPMRSASHHRGFHKFQPLPHQGSAEDQVLDMEPSGSNQQPLFNFFPSTMEQLALPSPTALSSSDVELGVSVDLNLKL